MTLLRFMATQEGFFGPFDIANDIGEWQRLFDFRPDNGLGDRGALAFEDYNHMMREIERDDLVVTPDHILVLKNAGPKGGPGMREMLAVTGADAYNVLINTGRVAGQAVMHVHVHLIPRRAGDALGYRWPAGKYPPGHGERGQTHDHSSPGEPCRQAHQHDGNHRDPGVHDPDPRSGGPVHYADCDFHRHGGDRPVAAAMAGVDWRDVRRGIRDLPGDERRGRGPATLVRG